MDNYVCIKRLGKGTFGKVYLMQHNYTEDLVAVKIIKKTDLFDAKNEIYNHAALGYHQNIVQFKKVETINENILIYLEYVNGTDLYDALQNNNSTFSEEEVKYYFVQILDGLTHCHSKGIYHRDLKLENVLLNENNQIKICDFGFSSSKYFEHDHSRSTGSLAYMAPEVIAKIKHDGEKVDIWCLGVMLFVLLCGYYPFEDKNIEKHLTNILRGNFSLPDYLSPECCDLIKQILVVQPKKRITLDGIKKHPWIL